MPNSAVQEVKVGTPLTVAHLRSSGRWQRCADLGEWRIRLPDRRSGTADVTNLCLTEESPGHWAAYLSQGVEGDHRSLDSFVQLHCMPTNVTVEWLHAFLRIVGAE